MSELDKNELNKVRDLILTGNNDLALELLKGLNISPEDFFTHFGIPKLHYQIYGFTWCCTTLRLYKNQIEFINENNPNI